MIVLKGNYCVCIQDEIEEDRRVLKRQLNEANEKLKKLGDSEKLYSEALGDQMNAPVPEKLLKKIKVSA